VKPHNNRELAVIEEIKNNPGIRYRELAKITKIPNSTIGYYIKKLGRNQIIVTSKIDNSCRFFMPEFSEIQCRVITMLRGKNTKKIILALEKEKMTFSSLVEKLETHPSTISVNLKKLINFEIVEKIRNNIFVLKTNDITNIVNKYKSITVISGLSIFHNILQEQVNLIFLIYGWYV